MKKCTCALLGCLILFFLNSCGVNAALFPIEGSNLNYRIIGFSFPASRTDVTYKIEIAGGVYYNEDSFNKHIIATVSSEKNKITAEVPSFGKDYTWRYVTSGTAPVKSAFYHFKTASGPEVDTNVTRLRILKHAEKYNDAYVFSQSMRTLYDMNGVPVWFLPESKDFPANDIVYGDFKITDRGTITFGRMGTDYEQAFEVNYNGKILWQSPRITKIDKDAATYNHAEISKISDVCYSSGCYASNKCHREFIRMANGHYMILESEFIWLRLPNQPDARLIKNADYLVELLQDKDKLFYQRIEYGKMIEYDAKGKVVWTWNSAHYFAGSDVYKYLSNGGCFSRDQVHENAFCFNKEGNVFYVSFKDISRILKVQYPSGNVLAVYGKLQDPASPGFVNDLFYHQHNCGLTSDGYLSLYNNNDRYPGAMPTLLLLQEPASPDSSLKKVWEYQCIVDGIDTAGRKLDFSGGGGVTALPDHSLLACMTSPGYTKMFIVNRNKEILWSAIPEKLNAVEKKWQPIMEYRATMILNKKDLEKLIWSDEMNK